MKLLVITGVTVLLVLTIYAGGAADAASAYSPEIRPVPTYEPFIDDEDWIYEAPVAQASPGSGSSFLAGPRGGMPPGHERIPGVSEADVEFLEKLHLTPAEFRESYLADGSNHTNFASANAKVTSDILNLPWVRDGLTDRETVAAAWLAVLDDFSPAAASRIAAMPFLRTFGPADKEAIQSLTYLAEYDDENDTNVLLDVLDNPNIADGGGIDDDEAKVVAVLGGANWENPELVDVLLDPSLISVVERRIQGRAGAIHLAVIRTAPGSASTMDLLEYAVRQAEVTMNRRLDTDYVGLLVADAVPGDASGANFGTHIAIAPGFDVDDRSEWPGNWASFLLAHEVAHYYWHDSVLWIDEGAADFMADVSENKRVGRPMEVDNVPCPYYRSIFHLELSNPRRGTWGNECNYALGERMFLDLHSALGDTRFYQGFRALHSLTQAVTEDDTTAPVNHLTAAFQRVALTPDQKTILNLVLARHYGSILLTDTSPVNPALPALNGRVESTELVRWQGGEIVERHSGFARLAASRISDYYWLRLDIPYTRALPAERELEFEIVEYYEDGFVFDRRTYARTFKAGYTGAYKSFCCIGFIPDYRWPTGLYWVYVYHEDQKIAELRFEVTP